MRLVAETVPRPENETDPPPAGTVADEAASDVPLEFTSVMLSVSPAHAAGMPRWRIAAVQILPNLLPVAIAQFLVTAPAYLLAEANLGLLGLGVPEPLPSLGGMLRELENVSGISSHPAVLAPALLLALIVICFQLMVSADKYPV